MAFCIPAGQVFDPCTTEFPVGLDGTSVLILPFSVWQNSTKTFAVNGALQTLTLPVGEGLYNWQAPKTSVMASSDNAKRVFAGTKYTHKVSLTGVGHSQDDFNRFEAVLSTEVVCFVREIDGSIKIFGTDTGMSNAGSTFDFKANDGTFPINLATNEEDTNFENKLPLTSNVTWATLLGLVI